jgi:hypothetical protein
MTRRRNFRVAGPKGEQYVSYQASDFLMRTPPEIRAITEIQKEDEMADAQLFLNAMTMVMQNPMMAQLVKLVPSAHELYRRMGIDNPDEYLHSDKPMDIYVTPQHEIDMLIANIDVPVMNRVNPEDHYNAISDFVNSDRFDLIPPPAQQRVAERGEIYKRIMGMAGQMPPNMAMPGSNAVPSQVAGGLISGGQTVSPVQGQANRMAAGTSPTQVAIGGA